MLKTNCPKVAKFVLILLIAPLVFVAHFTLQKAYAQTSSTINFQGKIVRNDTGYEGLNVTTGSPACVKAGSDECDFQVKYYSASTSGTLYFTETYTDVEIGQYGGIFNLSLGAGTPTTGAYSSLDAMIKEQDSVYVEILFSPAGTSSFTETFSRMPLQASAYAIRSKYSEIASGAFEFENAADYASTTRGLTTPASNGMVYYDTTAGVLKLYSAGVWQDLATGGSSIWGSNSISSYSHYPSQFMETSGIATLSNFGVDATVNRAWVHGASSRTGFSVYSNYSGATDWPLVTFKADASNFGNSILQLTQDGTGNILEGLSGSTPVFNFDKRGDLHLSNNGVNYFEPFAVAPTTGDLYPGSGEGCLYNVAGTLYWDATCNYNGAALSTGSSSRWTDAGSFTYLTSTTDDVLFGGNSTATATFFFDVDASSGNYLAIDNAANTQRLFTIDSNGNVGIGTATPGSKLDIGGANSNITNSTGDITITPNQNLILGSGNFGVGTATPNQKLSVAGTFGIIETGASPTYYTIFQGGDQNGNITYTLPTTSTTGILANNGSGVLSWATLSSLGGVTGTGSGSGTAGQITFWSGTSSITGSNNFWWDNANQRLGIGTSSPQASLDIAGATSEIANVTGNITIIPAQNLILGSGNFGIGTPSPSYKLHVTETLNQSHSTIYGYANQTSTSTDYLSIGVEGLASGANSTWGRSIGVWGHSNKANTFRSIGVVGSLSTTLSIPSFDFNTAIWGDGSGLGYSGIFTGGNVGIGVTNPSYTLEVNGNASFSNIYFGNGGSRTQTRDDIGLQGSAGAQSGFFETASPSPAANWYPGASGWQHYIDVRHSNTSNNHALQIAGAFGDQDLYFRKTAGSPTTAWNKFIYASSNGNVAIATPSASVPTLSLGRASGQPSIKSTADWLIMDSNTSPAALNYYSSQNVSLAYGGGNVGIGINNPAITLAIGDSDTGFQWISDGVLALYSNNAEKARFDSNTASFSTDVKSSYYFTSRHTSPTMIFQDSNNRSAMIHVNSNLFYVLRGSGTDSTTWSQYDGQWPLVINLENNNANFGGNVGIGSPGTSYKFELSSSAATYSAMFENTYTGTNKKNIMIRNYSSNGSFSTSDYLVVFSNTYNWGVNGRINGNGTGVQYTTSSDARLKTNVNSITNALDTLMQMDAVSYNWIHGGVSDVGFLAQELQPLYPFAVSGSPSNDPIMDPMTIDYGKLTPIIVAGVKDLNSKVDSNLLKIQKEIGGVKNLLALSPSPTSTISSPGWYRISKLDTSSDYAKIKINNSTIGSSQNLILSIDSTNTNNSINVISNFTTGENNISKARINTVNGIKYLEVYLDAVNNNSIKISIENGNNTNWTITNIAKVDNEVGIKEYALEGVLFGVSDAFSVKGDSITTSGTLLTSSLTSNIGNSSNRWNDIYTKGTIRLGSGSSEGGIRYNVEKKRLEFSNDGAIWIEMGDLTSSVVISPEYSGAILYADGTDNYGRMTSDAIETGGVFKNYYEWKSDRETLQDYDILVRITLPTDFVSWKDDAISLDFMTENSASVANNKVDIALMGNSGIDGEVKDGISKLPGSWERVSIKSTNITQCKKAGDSCTVRLSMYSKENYFVRVGDISLNYNRGL